MTSGLGSRDTMSFLRESELFHDLSDDVLRAVLLQSSTKAYAAGDRVFDQGEPGDGLFVVKSGVVEILTASAEGPTVLAYLGRGECIGEVALLTGSPRTAAARVPERAELIHLSKEVFDDLIMNFPILLKGLCVILARRLEKTLARVPTPITSNQLQGQLRYFDLGLMLQTLVDSKQTGRLALDIRSAGNAVRAEIFFSEGAIAWAKMGRLYGVEAVYQLFQMSLDGSFNFAGSSNERPPHSNVSSSSISLLLESARLHDELGELVKRLPDPNRVFRHAVSQLQWTDLETVDLASEVWLRLEPGASLKSVLEAASFCAAKVYQVVWEMLQSKQIA